jgi:hypothetical protein
VIDPEPLSIDGASALLYRDAPLWDGARAAAIGEFVCENVSSGRRLLEKAKAIARDEDFSALIGPMNGDTWHRYRVVTESDGSPPFAMEPVNGPHDRAAFLEAGFLSISEYVSSRARLVDVAPKESSGPADVSISPWDGRGAEALISRIFKLSLAGFAHNRFFKPISIEAFQKLYEPVMPMVDPRFVLFAHAGDGSLVGFLFGFPDRRPGAPAKTVILKTYASGLRGVGRLLADRFHACALDLGYVDVVHALMHADNISLERSKRLGAVVFRKYALMGQRL